MSISAPPAAAARGPHARTATKHIWASLFGPVLFYDLIRMTRRGRYFIVRGAYVGALAILLYWQYTEWFGSVLAQRKALDSKLMAAFAAQFFNKFMVLQFLLVGLLTPIYTASAIAEEKERKTIEYLLATDLRDREIVLSKLFSRLLNLALMVMTGLPVLGLIQLLGGVDPGLVLGGFAATAVFATSLASVGILCSVYTSKSRNAILMTYIAVAAYLALGFALENARVAIFSPGPSPPQGWDFVVDKAIRIFNAGNLPLSLSELSSTWILGQSVGGIMLRLLGRFALFHTGLFLVCIGWSIWRLRVLALAQGQKTGQRLKNRSRRAIMPRMGRWPMVWKELFIEPGFRLGPVGKIIVGMFVLLSLIPAAYILLLYLDAYAVSALSPTNSRHVFVNSRYFEGPDLVALALPRARPGLIGGPLAQHLHGWARMVGTIVACLMLLAVGVRASTSVSGERDRDTLDALLATPLHSHDILFAKWMGSIASVRWCWLWIGLIWLIGVTTGAIHHLAPFLVIAAWLVYASAFAGIGLWYSTASRTSMRATVYTLCTCIAVSGGHWAIWFCCLPLGLVGVNEITWLQAALTPPFVLYWFAAGTFDMNQSLDWELLTLAALMGLLFWGVGCLVLWAFCRTHFRHLTARVTRHQPRALEARDPWSAQA
jgi:ABC-type transport system involved in multi-copper enzyme maturation permease subunit